MSVRKTIICLFMSIQMALIVWMIRMYINTRLELMEAQNLIRWMFVRDTTTRERLTGGSDTDWVSGRLSTNQYLFIENTTICQNSNRWLEKCRPPKKSHVY